VITDFEGSHSEKKVLFFASSGSSEGSPSASSSSFGRFIKCRLERETETQRVAEVRPLAAFNERHQGLREREAISGGDGGGSSSSSFFTL
jgi:hypothetical protein